MLSKTLGSYGGPHVDAKPVENPQSQVSASSYDRQSEDTAQMTRTAARSTVEFLTNASTNPPAGDVSHESVWGSGDAQKPTVTRTGTGLYTITWAASYTDELGVSESVNFRFPVGAPHVRTNDNNSYTAKIKTISANVVTLVVLDNTAVPAPSDLGGAAYVTVSMR